MAETAFNPSLPESGHDPVLLSSVIELLEPGAGMLAVDCTLGRAGHAAALSPIVGSSGLLIGLDVDPRNLEFARTRLEGLPAPARFFHANFAQLPEVLNVAGGRCADLLLADLGLSTNQLFDPSYGLSFAAPMPLDMRIDPRLTRTAADIVNSLREDDLADLLYQLADERLSRRIARAVCAARRVSPLRRTDELAGIVRDVYAAVRRPGPPDRIDPATRTFMALRMAVNQERENLKALLEAIPACLAPRGRAGIITFHSIEDRLVKQSFRAGAQSGIFELITRKPVGPDDSEVRANPRARSAKLRIVRRI